MTHDSVAGIYPVVTIKEERRVRRFVCNSVMVGRREGCIILTFFSPGEEGVQYWGNRAHGEVMPALDYFRDHESSFLSKKHDLELGVVEEFKRVIEFFECKDVSLEKIVKE